jgi:hypothetical protein
VVSLPRNAWSISSGITLPFTYESLVYFSGISTNQLAGDRGTFAFYAGILQQL